MRSVRRKLDFTPEERRRIGAACSSLFTSFEDFGRVAILHAVDEVEALEREQLGLGYTEPASRFRLVMLVGDAELERFDRRRGSPE